MIRRRECGNPIPKYGGAKCEGDNEETVFGCNADVMCSGNFKSIICNGKLVYYFVNICQNTLRFCTVLLKILLKIMIHNSCSKCCAFLYCFSVNGGWSDWMKSGDCSESCGGGLLPSIRTCTNPQPKHCGNECEGDVVKLEKCNVQECPSNTIFILSYSNPRSIFNSLFQSNLSSLTTVFLSFFFSLCILYFCTQQWLL